MIVEVDVFESTSCPIKLKMETPVNDILNISYNKNITGVSIFNLIGQEVLSKTSTSTINQIDMTQLPNGVYMVKVSADNQIKTIKVIKE